MNDFFEKIKNGANKAKKFNDENKRAKEQTPLFLMLINDSLPILTVVAYLLMGFLGNLWHPGWIIFLIIPLYYGTVACVKHKSAAMFPFPILIVGAYLLMGCIKGLWHPYWALLLTIPLYYGILALIKTKSPVKALDAALPFLVIAAYLALGFAGGWWHPGWIVFFAIPVYYTTRDTVRRYNARRKSAEEKKSDTYTIRPEEINGNDENND